MGQWCEPNNHHKSCNVLQIQVRMEAFVSRDSFPNITDGDYIKTVKFVLMSSPL